MAGGELFGWKAILTDCRNARETAPEAILRCSVTHTRPSKFLPIAGPSNIFPVASIAAGFNS